MIRNRWIVRASAVALVAVAVPTAAYSAAPSQFEDVSVKVSYSDLDIQSEAGAQELYVRLKRASKQACNVDLYLQSGLGDLSKAKACYRDALDKAVASVDSDSLTDIHSS